MVLVVILGVFDWRNLFYVLRLVNSPQWSVGNGGGVRFGLAMGGTTV